MKKKKVTVVLSLGAAALLLIGGISVYAHQTSDSGESETVYKETTAEYGTLTVGITESGSVTIGSISQDMAEDQYVFKFWQQPDKWNPDNGNIHQ